MTRWQQRLPFYYGWVIIFIAFVTMAVAVSARTSFSLLVPPLIDEFGWDRGLVAGAFSFGFMMSAVISPFVGTFMQKYGPVVIIECGVVLLTTGLLAATLVTNPWQFYLALGLATGAGANMMSFTAQSLFLPNWFLRRRAMAIGIAFSGVGVGAVVLLPWLQSIILGRGWREACWALGIVVLCVLGPLNLLVRHKPQDIGLLPDGDRQPAPGAAKRPTTIVDAAWAATVWTPRSALGTARFWWIAVGFFCALVIWYMVQVHQTKYMVEIGFGPSLAAWSLGIVSVVAIPGQIGLGALSDRIGREAVWSLGCAGFALCYVALIAMEHAPSPLLLYAMIFTQGFFGYALTSVMGPIVLEIFEGPHYGAIFGLLTLPSIGGGAVGPWLGGIIHDATGSYRLAFFIAIACSVLSAVAIWLASPGKVRVVPGKLRRAT
ncbi:MAG: MFS transporter [Reyranellaceae bacterium]